MKNLERIQEKIFSSQVSIISGSDSAESRKCKDDELHPEYMFDTKESARDYLSRGATIENGQTSTEGPCIGQGKHWRLRPINGVRQGAVVSCPCCEDTLEGPVVREYYRAIP